MKQRALIAERSYPERIVRILWGLALYSLGILFTIQANLGLAPWDALNMGVSYHLPLSYGAASVVIGLVVLLLDLILHEKIGIGTILNTLLIGPMVDLMRTVLPVPVAENFLVGISFLLLGQFIIAWGSYYYMAPAMGCGPRDSLMVALGRRFSRFPIGAIRAILEGTVLLCGFLLGAKVGIGTVIMVFGMGLMLQLVCKIVDFDTRAVRHESIFATWHVFLGRGKEQAPTPTSAAADSENPNALALNADLSPFDASEKTG